MKHCHRNTGCALVGALIIVGLCRPATAGTPQELARGEAPLLFTSSERANAASPVTLRDGQAAVGDDIWLWVPAVTAGQVDLSTTGQFFKVWDSGPVAGPNGNDDDRNGMRGMDFNPATGKFLISYEDTTTTGFDFGNIRDGDLMELNPTSVSGGTITGFTWNRLFAEGPNGVAGNIGTGDINAISSASDGSLFIGVGGSQTINTTIGNTLSVGSSSLAHLDPNAASGSPENIGDELFFEAGLAGQPVIFPPAIYTGQLRGADILDDGELTFGTSGDYKNTVFTGPIDGLTDAQAELLAIDVETVCQAGDICSVPNHGDLSLNTFQRRFAEVLYSGDLFFQTPNVDNAKLLDHDILDTAAEIQALINVLGADSASGQALAAFVPEPNALALLGFGVLLARRTRRTTFRHRNHT